jgi:hypothetical protein
MSLSEYPAKKAVVERTEKFATPAQIEARLAVLNQMQFKPGQRGVGSRDLEVKLLTRRLIWLQNPPLAL